MALPARPARLCFRAGASMRRSSRVGWPCVDETAMRRGLLPRCALLRSRVRDAGYPSAFSALPDVPGPRAAAPPMRRRTFSFRRSKETRCRQSASHHARTAPGDVWLGVRTSASHTGMEQYYARGEGGGEILCSPLLLRAFLIALVLLGFALFFVGALLTFGHGGFSVVVRAQIRQRAVGARQ